MKAEISCIAVRPGSELYDCVSLWYVMCMFSRAFARQIPALSIVLALMIFGPAPSPAENAAKFTIGVTVALSGPFAEFGTAVRNGVEMARIENGEICRDVNFIYEDDRYDPKLTLSALQKFKTFDHADLLFVWGNEPALAAVSFAESSKIPLIVVSQHPAVAVGKHYVIRFLSAADDYGRVLAEGLAKRNIKRIGVIKTELSFHNILLDALKSHLKSDQQLEVFETLQPGDQDFRSIITRLRAQKFDALGLYLTRPQLPPFLRQAEEQHFRMPYFGTTAFENSGLQQDFIKLLDGAIFAHLQADAEFGKRYQTRFGESVQLAYAAHAYDFAKLTCVLFNGLSRKPDSEEILKAFAAAPPQAGMAGKFAFEESPQSGKYFQFPVVLRTIGGD